MPFDKGSSKNVSGHDKKTVMSFYWLWCTLGRSTESVDHGDKKRPCESEVIAPFTLQCFTQTQAELHRKIAKLELEEKKTSFS